LLYVKRGGTFFTPFNLLPRRVTHSQALEVRTGEKRCYKKAVTNVRW
jgi:hypothetical protein